MRRVTRFVALILGLFTIASGNAATSVSFYPVWANSATDYGPSDGVFDDFVTPAPPPYSISNNGYTEMRTAFEVALTALPAGASIVDARLTLRVATIDGNRMIAVHGYPGDGLAGLADFAAGTLLGTHEVLPTGLLTEPFTLDVTAFVSHLLASGGTVAGFNVRESPPNTDNFFVMVMDVIPEVRPVLTIDYEVVKTVGLDIKPKSMPNSVNVKSKGNIPVAILSEGAFYAPSEVDVASLTFGRIGDEVSLRGCDSNAKDVNDDGLLDLTCYFDSTTANFMLGDTEGVLQGETVGGLMIKGTDSVRIVR